MRDRRARPLKRPTNSADPIFIARSERKYADVKKVVILVAVAGLTVMIIAAGGTRTNRHPVATPDASNAAARTKTTPPPSATGVGETTTSRHQTTSLKVPTKATHAETHKPTLRPPAATPTAAVTRPDPTTSPTTATPNPAQVAAVLTQALKACLVLAAVDNARVVAANNTWYQTQLSGLTARHMLASGLYKALQIEQAQTQTLIQAQSTIDVSNCYLKFA